MKNWQTEYPRPQFRRGSFFSLNGEWQANGQTIEVPFPPQSALSRWHGDVPENIPMMNAMIYLMKKVGTAQCI